MHADAPRCAQCPTCTMTMLTPAETFLHDYIHMQPQRDQGPCASDFTITRLPCALYFAVAQAMQAYADSHQRSTSSDRAQASEVHNARDCSGDEDEGYVADEPDESDDMALFEQAMRDCGLNEQQTWCSLGGTEHCAYRCPFQGALRQR